MWDKASHAIFDFDITLLLQVFVIIKIFIVGKEIQFIPETCFQTMTMFLYFAAMTPSLQDLCIISSILNNIPLPSSFLNVCPSCCKDILQLCTITMSEPVMISVPIHLGMLKSLAYGIGFYFNTHGVHYLLHGEADLNSRDIVLCSVDCYYQEDHSAAPTDILSDLSITSKSVSSRTSSSSIEIGYKVYHIVSSGLKTDIFYSDSLCMISEVFEQSILLHCYEF